MPAAQRRAAADPYADLPVATRRANLEAHRRVLLSDRMAQELHAERLGMFEDKDAAGALERVAKFDELIAAVDDRLAGLPEDEPPADDDKDAKS